MCVRPAAVRDTNPHYRALCSVNQPPNLLWVMDIQQKRLFECYLKNIKSGFSTSFLGCFVLLLWDETKQSRRCRQVHMGVLPLQGLGKDNLVMVKPSGSPFDIRGKASRNLETQCWFGLGCAREFQHHQQNTLSLWLQFGEPVLCRSTRAVPGIRLNSFSHSKIVLVCDFQ